MAKQMQVVREGKMMLSIGLYIVTDVQEGLNLLALSFERSLFCMQYICLVLLSLQLPLLNLEIGTVQMLSSEKHDVNIQVNIQSLHWHVLSQKCSAVQVAAWCNLASSCGYNDFEILSVNCQNRNLLKTKSLCLPVKFTRN